MHLLIKFLPLLYTTKSLTRTTAALQGINIPSSLVSSSFDRIQSLRRREKVPFSHGIAFSSTSIRLFARMPRNVKKQHLPSKICVVCNRPFTWRKKWEKVWDEVTTCSKSCNRERRTVKQKENRAANYGEQVKDSLQLDGTSFPTNNKASHDDISSSDRSQEGLEEITSQMPHELNEENINDPVERAKIERKLAKKLKKAQRRAEREGRGDPSAGQKTCDVCNNSVDLLIRCMIDETAQWHMVCGKCWNGVSGGVTDGDTAHPYYRYGGLWKNRRAVTS